MKLKKLSVRLDLEVHGINNHILLSNALFIYLLIECYMKLERVKVTILAIAIMLVGDSACSLQPVYSKISTVLSSILCSIAV
jgi:hypothetical protein